MGSASELIRRTLGFFLLKNGTVSGGTAPGGACAPSPGAADAMFHAVRCGLLRSQFSGSVRAVQSVGGAPHTQRLARPRRNATAFPYNCCTPNNHHR